MGKIFLRGLLAITPVALTVALFLWIFWVLENTFSAVIKGIFGSQFYFPGLGIIVALIFIFFIGTIINNFLIQKIYQFNDRIMRKIPLIKTLYNAISDVVGFFSSGHKEKLGHVVLVEFQGMKVLGFVTRESFEDFPTLGTEDEVAVYIPFSYQIGGYTFMIPKNKLKDVEITVEDAMRFAITAGILKDHKTESPEQKKS